MKKLIFASMAAGLVLASCSNEEFDVKPAGQEGTVTFTASLPASVASRLYSDGQTAKNLQYAVYMAGEQAPLIEGTATFTNLKATVSTTLATGKSYDILFWAQADDAPYAFNAQTQEVTVTYEGITANNESLDAFFFAEKDLAVNGPVNKTVTLTRPFAQLNIGTNDFAAAEAAGVKVTESSIKVSTYSKLNLYDGTVSGEVDAEFALAAIPQDETFPVENYEYLSMAYVLVDAEKQLVDVTLGIDASEANAPVFAGVPVQRNYRTNIYGALLTNPAIFDVEINPDYEGDFDFGSLVAPGVLLNEAAKTYTITAPQGLQWLSSQSNGKNNAFAGYTIKLGNDIDMAGQDFTPIAKGAYFGGTFDGDGHTIANLTVSDPDCSGLVWSNRGMMKNITMKNVNVTGNFKVGAIAGDGLCGHFDNCVVDGGTITSTPRKVNGKYDDGNNAGGITGYLSAEPNASLTNCTVKNVTLMAYRTVGSIAGTVGGGNAVVSGNTAENNEVVANQLITNYDGYPRAPQAEELFGRVINGAAEGAGNTATGITIKVISAPADGNYTIGSAVELKALESALVSGQSFQGKTITFSGDIDGEGMTWNAAVWSPSSAFKKLSIEGNNATIKNLAIVGGFLPSGYHGGISVKNLTFENCEVTRGPLPGSGMLFAQIYGDFTVENVHVKGGSVTGPWACGAIAGQFTNEDDALYTATFTNCSVENVAVSATGIGAKAGIGGANAFIGACVAWDIHDVQKEIAVNMTGCSASGNTFSNGADVKGGGLYTTSKVSSATGLVTESTVVE
ncbi:MAG: hypothetical protein NC210_10040 [[Clostridium] fimetarium]|nr:hypothetical protein [[Clostridium] fimetarium]